MGNIEGLSRKRRRPSAASANSISPTWTWTFSGRVRRPPPLRHSLLFGPNDGDGSLGKTRASRCRVFCNS